MQARSVKEFWRQVGGASLVVANWRQIGPSSSFSIMVQYSAVTVQYSVKCNVSAQCDQLCVMSVFSRDLSWNISGARAQFDLQW